MFIAKEYIVYGVSNVLISLLNVATLKSCDFKCKPLNLINGCPILKVL